MQVKFAPCLEKMGNVWIVNLVRFAQITRHCETRKFNERNEAIHKLSQPVIARICVADSWQSILANLESKANLGLWANLNVVIDSLLGGLIQLFFKVS